MAYLPESPVWEEGIYQYEITDELKSGPDGIDNRQGKELANRTLFLKNDKAPLDSPEFTGTPTVPTPETGDRSTRIANTEWVEARIPFGNLISFEMEPTPMELALWRCLPLNGQVVEIAAYQRLCDRKYCGDELNDTAEWWYKTSDPEGLVRDTEGAYMVVLDHRGVFVRGAGQNSKYKMANDAPYDGMGIGDWIGDAIRNIQGQIKVLTPAPAEASGIITEAIGIFAGNIWQGTGAAIYNVLLGIDASRNVPTALENRPASISAKICITY
jgi:hypothetical protein